MPKAGIWEQDQTIGKKGGSHTTTTLLVSVHPWFGTAQNKELSLGLPDCWLISLPSPPPAITKGVSGKVDPTMVWVRHVGPSSNLGRRKIYPIAQKLTIHTSTRLRKH